MMGLMSLPLEKSLIFMTVKELHLLRTKSNMDGMDKLVETLKTDFTGLSF